MVDLEFYKMKVVYLDMNGLAYSTMQKTMDE
jgi:hypothetical protein